MTSVGSHGPKNGQQRFRVRCVGRGRARTRTLFVFAAVPSQAEQRTRAMLRDDYHLDPDNYRYEIEPH